MNVNYIHCFISYKKKELQNKQKRKRAGGGETKIYTICNYRLDTIDRCGCNFGFLPSQMAENFKALRLKAQF